MAATDRAPDLEPVQRLSRDLAQAARLLSDDEARYLVDAYYMMQEDRKRAHNQVRALAEGVEPSAVMAWLATQSETLENQIRRALDQYTQAHLMGVWMREIHGIGPVLSAGLLAHIDIEKAPTVGHIWRFAGLDPTSEWKKGERRPWNAQLKVLCWKVGQSFMKNAGAEACHYGHVYRERKAYEIDRNAAGGNAAAAAAWLPRVGKATEAYKHYAAGRLPPSQIDARARRYAVKLFLAHLHGVWFERHHGKPAPLPYPIAKLPGHTHLIEPFNPASPDP
jgi:hypothetical protein